MSPGANPFSNWWFWKLHTIRFLQFVYKFVTVFVVVVFLFYFAFLTFFFFSMTIFLPLDVSCLYRVPSPFTSSAKPGLKNDTLRIYLIKLLGTLHMQSPNQWLSKSREIPESKGLGGQREQSHDQKTGVQIKTPASSVQKCSFYHVLVSI